MLGRIYENINDRRWIGLVSAVSGLSSTKSNGLRAVGLDLKACLSTIAKQFYVEALEPSDGDRKEAAKLIDLNPPGVPEGPSGAVRERLRH